MERLYEIRSPGAQAQMAARRQSKVNTEYKTRYRVKNWAEYEESLRRRGDITIWFDAAAIDAWKPAASDRPGGQKKYSDLARPPLTATGGSVRLRSYGSTRWVVAGGARSPGHISRREPRMGCSDTSESSATGSDLEPPRDRESRPRSAWPFRIA